MKDLIYEAYQNITEASPMSVTMKDIKNKKAFSTGSTITTDDGIIKIKSVQFTMGTKGQPNISVDIYWKTNDGKSGTQKMSAEALFKTYLT